MSEPKEPPGEELNKSPPAATAPPQSVGDEDDSEFDILKEVEFRSVTPTDIHQCIEIEKASYPPDERASKWDLQFRQHHAAPYFQCAYLEHPEDEDEVEVVGFINATRCHVLTRESLSSHQSEGPLLAIHSVTVAEEYRRHGLATKMMKHYIHTIRNLKDDSPIQKLVLLSKKNLLSLFVNCGFSVVRPSALVHGQEQLYDVELDLQQLDATAPIISRAPGTGHECHIVDAFASPDKPGTGNPAAVVILPSNFDPSSNRQQSWMQVVAAEFNLSETAFCWPDASTTPPTENDTTTATNSDESSEWHWNIRYYTPKVEVPLCGHATLASAAVLFQTRTPPSDTKIVFHTSQTTLTMELAPPEHDTDPTIPNGDEEVTAPESTNGEDLVDTSKPGADSQPPSRRNSKNNLMSRQDISNSFHTKLQMEFPVMPATELSTRDDQSAVCKMLESTIKHPVSPLFIGLSELGDVLIELTPAEFQDIGYDDTINYKALLEWDGYYRGVILCCLAPPVSSTSNIDTPSPDFLSRFFGPKAGIDEDPVTGSAHCVSGPYFSQKLNKPLVIGQQTSERGGMVQCLVQGNKVVLTGTAVTTMSGTLWQ
jgi:predicted PhzF superfamily epimerase YddE/YHI9/ribosomal protein S18 acetylase RimI-like enzyme